MCLHVCLCVCVRQGQSGTCNLLASASWVPEIEICATSLVLDTLNSCGKSPVTPDVSWWCVVWPDISQQNSATQHKDLLWFDLAGTSGPPAFPRVLTEVTENFGSWLWRTWELEGRISLEVCSHLVSIVNFWSVRLQDPASVFYLFCL